MKRFSMIGMAFLAVMAVGAFAASSAFALPEISKQGKWTGKNDGTGEPTLETLAKSKITCKEATASGEDTSASLGTFTIHFKSNCASGGFTCRSLGDAVGFILTGGTYHYVWDTLTTLGVAILFLPNELHLECASGLVLIIVKSQSANGGIVCLLLEPSSSKATHLFHCEQTSGDQSERTYWNDSGTEIKNAELLCSTNEGSFESCAELALGEVTYTAAVSILNV